MHLNIYLRLLLNCLIFGLAILSYEPIHELLGYMYSFKLQFSNLNLVISLVLLVLLTIITNIEKSMIVYCLDIFILGIFLPVAVMVVIQGISYQFLLYPAIFILFVMLTLILTRNKNPTLSLFNSKITLNQLQKIIAFAFSIPLLMLVASNFSILSSNMLETYNSTYEIRAVERTDGLLGYFLNWFNMVFFPLFLVNTEYKNKYLFGFLAFLGAFFVFQKYALKIIFFNFILTLIFSYFHKYIYSFLKYIVHLFFILLFSLSWVLGEMYFSLLDRFFYIIGINSIYYFEYYSEHDLRYFESTKLDFGISETGKLQGYTIDEYYYQGLGSNQSAGFLPTIYSDLGVFGIILGSIFIAYTIKILFSFKNISDNYTFLLLISFSFLLMNFSLNMIPLSGGLFFILFFLSILSRDNDLKSLNLVTTSI
jgi:hypothetical protein